ncbi:MAG: hypothetical protein COA79_14600 [Planctomycetota bacterium]|nr:MAG: hypothetical protein COA79_14600 [Planctomycetota bacterium]
MISKQWYLYFFGIFFFANIVADDSTKPYILKIHNIKNNVYANRVQNWTDEVYQNLSESLNKFKLKTSKLHIHYYYDGRKFPKMISLNKEFFIVSAKSKKKNTVLLNKNPLGSDYAEFHFKKSIAEIFLKNSAISSQWLQSGIAIDIASNNLTDPFCRRNYLYLALLLSDKKSNPEIKQILAVVTYPKKSKEKLIFDAHSWLLYSYLKTTNKKFINNNLLNDSNVLTNISELNLFNNDLQKYIRKISIGLKPSENTNFSTRNKIVNNDIAQFISDIANDKADLRKKKIKKWVNNNQITHFSIKPFLTDNPKAVISLALEIATHLNSRELLPTVISMAISNKDNNIKSLATQTVKSLNMGYFPFMLTKYLHHKNLDISESTADLMYELADKTIALAALGNLNGSTGKVDGYVAFTTSRNYISDYDVVDGVLKPVVSTVHEGIVLSVKVLWVTRVQSRLVGALNNMALGMQFQTANQWIKWNKTN